MSISETTSKDVTLRFSVLYKLHLDISKKELLAIMEDWLIAARANSKFTKDDFLLIKNESSKILENEDEKLEIQESAKEKISTFNIDYTICNNGLVFYTNIVLIKKDTGTYIKGQFYSSKKIANFERYQAPKIFNNIIKLQGGKNGFYPIKDRAIKYTQEELQQINNDSVLLPIIKLNYNDDPENKKSAKTLGNELYMEASVILIRNTTSSDNSITLEYPLCVNIVVVY